MPEGFFYFLFYTPLYEKDIKQNQNKPMETTTPGIIPSNYEEVQF